MASRRTYSWLFRREFVGAWSRRGGESTFHEHCERFGVSRQTGYDWLARYREEGDVGLETKSSAPHECPHATNAAVSVLIIEARKEHPTWGPRKLRAWLQESVPWDIELPAPSTMGSILQRAGLVSAKRRRRRASRYAAPFKDIVGPNDVWATDFKGHFRTGDGRYCYPLTLTDSFSRYLLRCDAYIAADRGARASFEAAFIEYGLPAAIRSDNGTPFSANTPAGLSTLSVWWIRLGITPERITPASPWENGRHERMHRTLKAEATRPPQANRKQQQLAFDAFRDEFNHDRPHEGIGQKVPASLYNPSGRSYPRTMPELEYPDTYQLRRVSNVGVISWAGHRLFVTNVLRGEVVGLHQLDDETWDLYFGPVLLGRLRGDRPQLERVRKEK